MQSGQKAAGVRATDHCQQPRRPSEDSNHLVSSARRAIVIAGNGMCSSGRIVNYLKALLGDPRHDVLFVGYQARGTPGHAIQCFGPRNGDVEFDGQRYEIRAGVHSIGGYSAHADQEGLLGSSQKWRSGRKRSVWYMGRRGRR